MFCLVHSPFVGPSTWDPVAVTLRSRDRGAVVPTLPAASDSGSIWEAQVDAIVGAGADAEVLAAHSGSGSLLPLAAAALAGTPRLVFVDATLPHPGRSRLDEMPDSMQDRLLGLAAGGRLPPWHRWFGEGVLAGLIPDEAERVRFEAGNPEIPLRMLSEPMPPTPELRPERCAYLRLSEAYDGAAGRARELGWRVKELDLHHLAPLTHAVEVTEAILDLTGEP